MRISCHDWGVYVEEAVRERNGNVTDIFEDESCRIRYIKDFYRSVNKYNAPVLALSVLSDRICVLFGEIEEEELFKIFRIANSSFAGAMARRGRRVRFTRTLRYCMDRHEMTRELKKITTCKDTGESREKGR